MTSKRASVLIAILMILMAAGLLVSAVFYIRDKARQLETRDKLKQIALAMHACSDVHKMLPPAFDVFADCKYPASVHAHLLPFIGKNPVYPSYLKDGITSAVVPEYYARADYTLEELDGIQNFAANLRVFSDKGVNSKYTENLPALSSTEPGHSSLIRTFTDGTSNTIAFATKLAICGDGGSHYAANPTSPFAAFIGQNAGRTPASVADPEAIFQLAPRKGDCLTSPLMAQSFSAKGLTVALADASVRTAIPSSLVESWNDAMHPCNGVAPGLDDW